MSRDQVVERLSLGRSVAAEVTTSIPGHRGFVFVVPLVDASRTKVLESPSGFGEPFTRRNVPNEDVISGYRVKYTVLRPGWEDTPDDWDLFLRSADESVLLSLPLLEHALRSQWGLELADLRLPHDVDHPF